MYERLMPKTEKYGVTALISVFGNHFDINIYVVSEEAEEYVCFFKELLQSVSKFYPLGYYNDTGANITAKVQKNTCPTHLAFVLVEASISLRSLHSTFASRRPFNQQFYLNVSQTYKHQQPQATTTVTTSTSTTVPPPASSAPGTPRAQSIPVRLFGTTQLYPSPTTVITTPNKTTNAPISNIGAAIFRNGITHGSNSNSSWDLDELMKKFQRWQKLMGGHRYFAHTNMLSYHGP